MYDIKAKLQVIASAVTHGWFSYALAELRKLGPQLIDNGNACQLRGQAHYGLGEFKQAMAALELASLLTPLRVAAQIQLAECYVRFRHRDLAHTMYSHLATLDHLSEAEVEAVAVGIARVGEHALAIDFCVRHLRHFRGNHSLLSTVVDSMRRLEYTSDEILPFASQAHRLQPDNICYRIALAQNLLRGGRRGEAVRLLQGVDLDAVECVPSLERMRRLFTQLGETDGTDHCRARLEAIAYEMSTRYRPDRDSY